MNKPKVTPELRVTASISGGIAIVVSLISIVFSLLVIINRYKCNLGDDSTINNGWHFFWNTIFRVYIVEPQCKYSVDVPNITKSESIYILSIMTLCFSCIYFLAAVAIISVVKTDYIQYLDIVTCIFIGTNLAAFVVDLTLGAHFGMDMGYMKPTSHVKIPEDSEAYNVIDVNALGMVRVGAFILMSLSLKGYIIHFINIILLILLVVYLIDNRNKAKENEHSIHKLGALNGYDAPKPVTQENSWQQRRSDMFPGYARSNVNPMFNNDETPQHRPRENLSDYANTPTRSDSWLKSSMNSNAGMGSRPFSYLEEPKRPIPAKPPVTSTSDSNWRRDPWSGPHVPDPDYSPPNARRLKSALKPAY